MLSFSPSPSFRRKIFILAALFTLDSPSAFSQEAPVSPLQSPGVSDERSNPISSVSKIRELLAKQVPVETITLYDKSSLERFYAQRNHALAWSDNQHVETFLNALKNSEEDGLVPSVYHLVELTKRHAENGTHGVVDENAAALDLLLTDAFFSYSKDLRIGRVSPRKTEGFENWKLEEPTFDPISYLEQALSAESFSQALSDLPPPHPQYAALRQILQTYRQKAATTETWPVIADGAKLEKGMSDPRVATLRQRLLLSGELAADKNVADSLVMDEALADALKKFQEGQGLLADGILGKRAISALNMSPKHRVLQIIANMERWRWVPRQLEPTRLMINIPGQELDVYDDNARVMSMRVIVGSRTNKTPTLRSAVTSLTLNPHWTLPYSIASKEILPKLKKNPNYLSEQGMHIVEGEEYPEYVDWSSYGQRNFPYTIRQAAGPRNPLGRIKFNMPNSDDIYLHDTNNRGLFSRADRALSHGCVRLQQPMDLALFVLRNQPRWTQDTLNKAIETGTTQSLIVQSPVPVYLLYWTIWKDSIGTVQIRDDIYERDQRVIAALKKISPSLTEN